MSSVTSISLVSPATEREILVPASIPSSVSFVSCVTFPPSDVSSSAPVRYPALATAFTFAVIVPSVASSPATTLRAEFDEVVTFLL